MAHPGGLLLVLTAVLLVWHGMAVQQAPLVVQSTSKTTQGVEATAALGQFIVAAVDLARSTIKDIIDSVNRQPIRQGYFIKTMPSNLSTKLGMYGGYLRGGDSDSDDYIYTSGDGWKPPLRTHFQWSLELGYMLLAHYDGDQHYCAYLDPAKECSGLSAGRKHDCFAKMNIWACDRGKIWAQWSILPVGVVCSGNSTAKGMAFSITSEAIGEDYCLTLTNAHLKPNERSTAPLTKFRYVMAPCKQTCEQVFMMSGDFNTLDLLKKHLQEGSPWPCADAAKKAVRVCGNSVTNTDTNSSSMTSEQKKPEACRKIGDWQQCGGEYCEVFRAAYGLQKCLNAPWEGVCCDEERGFKCVQEEGTGWWGCQKR